MAEKTISYKPHRRRIIRIVLIASFVTLILVYTNYNFFIKIDIRENLKLNPVAEAQRAVEDIESGRGYHLIYDENDEESQQTRDTFIRILDLSKVKYQTYDIRQLGDLGENDYVILTINNWEYFSDRVDEIFGAVEDGASLLVTGVLSFDEIFIENSQKLGISGFFGESQTKSLVIKDDILLGLKSGEKFTADFLEDDITMIEVMDTARVYMEDERGVPLYFTINYGKGKIGVFNGYNLNERNLDGIILGMIGSLKGDFIYPIINAGVMFIDDWPGPFKGNYDIIFDQYGMSLDDFLKFIWWPDMVNFMKTYGVVYTGQFVHNYDNNMKAPYVIDKDELDLAMFYFGQQLIKHGCEIGLHGYNHQPLWFSEYSSEELLVYNLWEDKDDALNGLLFAMDQFESVFPEYDMNCYVPPSNVIDDQGIEIIKEVLGTPVILAGLYVGDPPETPQHEFEVKDDVIYFPRIASESILNDESKISMASAMTTYCVVSHFIHPDDITDPERSAGLDWGGLRSEFGKILEFIDESYPYLNYLTVTEAGNNLMDWDNARFDITYGDNGIKIKKYDIAETLRFILKTEKDVLPGEGYTYQNAGKDSYYIEVSQEQVTINMEVAD